MDLIADDELLSTVEAALAFIDACTEAGDEPTVELSAPLVSNGSPVIATSDGFDPTHSRCFDVGVGPEALGSALQQKRTRNAVASSRSRKKRQTELLVLREEEALLRDRLQAMTEWKLARDRLAVGPQKASVSLSTASNHCNREVETTDAMEVAERADHAHRERQRAEALNRRLRAALRKQRSITQHLSQLVQKRLGLKEVADLLHAASKGPKLLRDWAPSPTSSRIMDEKHSIVADLTQRLGPQVLSVDMALSLLESSQNESMEFVSRTRQDAGRGYVVELTSTTPLASSLEEAWSSLSAFVQGVQAEDAYQIAEKRAISVRTYKKEYSMTFEDPNLLGPVVVDDISLVQEAGSQHYRAFLWSALVRSQCGRSHIRVNGWVALSRSTASSSQRCVYHQQIEISTVSAASQDGALDSVLGGSGRYLQDFVLASMTAKIQRNQRKLADAMMRKHGGGMPPLVIF